MSTYIYDNTLGVQISVYWWNMGKKVRQFQGTYGDFLVKYNIIVIKELGKESDDARHGLRIKISAGYVELIMDYYEVTTMKIFDQAIKFYLDLIGDKTLFETPRNSYKINWS